KKQQNSFATPGQRLFDKLRALTKYRKNEAIIRNDGVYVISGIFREQMLAKRWRPEGLKCRAHEVRRNGTPRKRSAGRCETEKYIPVPIAGRRSPRSGA